MRLVSFRLDGSERVGVVAGDTVCDLAAAAPELPADVGPLLAGGPSALAHARRAIERAPAACFHERESLVLAPAVPRPGKIVCIGLNYRDHATEVGMPLPDEPQVFAKFASALTAHGSPIHLTASSEEVDAEAELAVVIGRRARNVGADRALGFVGGYAAANDVGARDWQMRGSQWTLSKSFDTFAPLGPSLTTADEIPDPQALGIRLTLGDEVLQDSNTAEMVFGVAALVSYLSGVMTLEPGDVILTGTPAGVGFTRRPPRYLRDGDVAVVEIEGLETLSNPVAAAT